MEFEIDVSGEDLLSKNYTICIANNEGRIKGFKFDNNLVNILSSRYGQGIYKYKKSQKGKANLKVRIYCAVVYYLIKSLNKKEISLAICRDFQGRENEIKDTLEKNFNRNGIKIEKIYFTRLTPKSNAHKYAYLMRNDSKNKLKTYIKITLEEIERFLKNKSTKE